MRFREDRLRELLKSKSPPWSMGQLHVQARRFRPTLAWRTLSEIINGKRQPTIEVVDALAQALDVDPSYLLDVSDTAGMGEPPAVELVGWRVELAPEIAELAQQLNMLPDDRRAWVAEVLAGLLALLGQDAEPRRETSTLTDAQREMLAYFDALNDENQALALDRLREMLAGRQRGSGGQTGARGSA